MSENKTFGCLLIVDDEPDILECLANLLKPYFTEIYTAADGAEALALINKTVLSAIVSDLAMPKLNGIDLLNEIRKRSLSTPFIILTGNGDHETATKALEMEAFDYIDKPWKLDSLLSTTLKAAELGQYLIDFQNHDVELAELKTLVAEHQRSAKIRLKNAVERYRF